MILHFRDALFNRTTSMAADLDRKAQQIDGMKHCLIRKYFYAQYFFVCLHTWLIYVVFRLRLRAAEQGPAGVPRHVHPDLRHHVPEERRGLPGVLQGAEGVLRQGRHQPRPLHHHLLQHSLPEDVPGREKGLDFFQKQEYFTLHAC
jgi:hypothetical protein